VLLKKKELRPLGEKESVSVGGVVSSFPLMAYPERERGEEGEKEEETETMKGGERPFR
jgi:hypothetical protein